MAAADLLRAFPDAFASCVVAVARKTDAALWPALFSAVGAPSALLEGLLEEGALGAAACFLLVIDRQVVHMTGHRVTCLEGLLQLLPDTVAASVVSVAIL
jgi:hypothetical protein